MKFAPLLFSAIACLPNVYSVELNDVIPDPYPQVYETVDVLPYDPHGWYWHHDVFLSLISTHQIKIAIEVGSWLGASARDIAGMLPADGILYSVDTWQGSEEHQPGEMFYYIPTNQLFQQFLSNVIHKGLQKKIIPVRLPSVIAAERLAPLNIKADFIYIDAAHDYESIKEDLNAWYPYLREGGIFCGDDWNYPPIVQAVNEFAAENNLRLVVDSCWFLVK